LILEHDLVRKVCNFSGSCSNRSPHPSFGGRAEAPFRLAIADPFGLLTTPTVARTGSLDHEHIMNYVPSMFGSGRIDMFRAVIEEAAALASITLFVGMIVVWAEVLCSF
jgi:hypothetical protein